MAMHYRLRILFLFLSVLFSSRINAQGCSATSKCSTGCCSKFGYCGTGPDFCSAANCVSTCDFKLGCDATHPCAAGTGCCSKFGFCGLGPDYCAPEVCVAGCNSKSYCDPGFSKPGYAEVETCPLNVCCSKWGFCGLTKEFCGDKKVARPSCGTSGPIRRVVGYYEGWAQDRRCDKFMPEDIPTGVYTHLNFAFAGIDPVTFEVVPASHSDVGLYRRLTRLKDENPELRVFIAIGGWTFNDPGPTASTFSDLAASEANQRKFFASLISFMSTYGFDGVDIDWEYPEAPDRSGRGIDFANFPTFIRNLKGALRGTNGRDGLSITLPASYWYLQHFDVVKLAQDVDFFNIMSYDLHGKWDQGNKWLGAYLNGHTNLTEIADALDLLWRNNIPAEKVVLGLAFYARTFTVTTPSCVTPGCTWESVGLAGECSNSIGTLTNAEINRIISSKGLTPKLYKEAAVKVITWENQWVAYDDGDTFQLKADFAREQCLGGVMVWAVSQDDTAGTSASKLATATKRKFNQPRDTSHGLDGLPFESVSVKRRQCRWSDCGRGCDTLPDERWVPMMRDDGDRHDTSEHNEIMTDPTFCGSMGHRTLCCPAALEQPSCGWYTHGGKGHCTSQCPDDYTEVGSLSKDCNNGGYQAACCTSNVAAVQLYSQCHWKNRPKNCNSEQCSSPDIQLVQSDHGSGGVECGRDESVSQSPFQSANGDLKQRPYCCLQYEGEEWNTKSCGWYYTLGGVPDNEDPNSYCQSSCPNDMTRIAMDTHDSCNSDGGARAYCCEDNLLGEVIQENSVLTNFRDSLDVFLADPVCKSIQPFLVRGPDGPTVTKRGNSSFTRTDIQSLELISLDARVGPTIATYGAILRMLVSYFSPSTAEEWKLTVVSVWDAAIAVTYPFLVFSHLAPFFYDYVRDFASDTWAAMDNILCNLEYFNLRLSGDTTRVRCDVEICSFMPEICVPNEDEDFGPGTRKLRLRGDEPGIDFSPMDEGQVYHILEPRQERFLRINLINPATGTRSRGPYTWDLMTFYTSGQWPTDSEQHENAMYWTDEEDCGNARLSFGNLAEWMEAHPQLKNPFASEHIFEAQTISMFISATNLGVLSSKAISKFPKMFDFWYDEWTQSFVIGNPLPGGFNSRIPFERIMEALGSKRNKSQFVVLLQKLNLLKAGIWGLKNPVESGRMKKLVKNLNKPSLPLSAIRNTITVFNYLEEVHEEFVAIGNLLREQWQIIDKAYNALHPNTPINLAERWDEWLEDFLVFMPGNAKGWVEDELKNMETIWARRPGSTAALVQNSLRKLKDQVNVIKIDTNGLDGF